MTEIERSEALKLSRKYFGKEGPGYIGTATFIAGYAAACEAKEAEVEWLMSIIEDYAQDVHRAIVSGDLGIGERP